MTKIRGIFPIFLATALGIGNGIWVFGPAFKEQQQEKADHTKKALEVAKQSENSLVESLPQAEAAASQTLATEAALKPVEKFTSWWPSMSLWTKEVNKPPAKEVGNNDLEIPKSTPR